MAVSLGGNSASLAHPLASSTRSDQTAQWAKVEFRIEEKNYADTTSLTLKRFAAGRLHKCTQAWYRNTSLTLSDAIAAVRREIWHHQTFAISRSHRDSTEMQAHIWSRMEIAITHAR